MIADGMQTGRRDPEESLTFERRQLRIGDPNDLAGGTHAVDVITCGPADGPALVYHSGTPSGPALLAPLADLALRSGLRYISVSRPGYGQSDERPGRTVADVVPDVLAVLDELGHESFVSLGWSGGGPHSLACGALAPGRCRAAAIVAGVAPRDGEGLDWYSGMGSENLEEFGQAEAGGREFDEWLQQASSLMSLLHREDLAAGLGDLVSKRDVEAIDGPVGDYLYSSVLTAFESGVAGWRDDDVAFLKGWGFEVGHVAVPVLVVQGTEDRMVPIDHGRWIAERLSSGEFWELAGEGHISAWVKAPEIVAWLRQRIDS